MSHKSPPQFPSREAPPFEWRHQFDPVRDRLERTLSDIVCADESLTVQAAADGTDINILVRRFGLDKAGIPPAVLDPSYFGDFTDTPDLRSALEQLRTAQAHFDALPPGLRARFRNSPADLWDFVNDPDNVDEAVRLGLFRRPEEPPTPIPVPLAVS